MDNRNCLVSFWQEKIKRTWKTAFFAVLFFGLIAHTYKFTNTLYNHDALFNGHTTQNTIELGRWFLSVACGIGGFFDLPWMNGLLSLFWIGITAAVIAEIFAVRDPIVLILEGGLLVTFPCITNTFFYEYTADGYMIAMLFASLAVYFSRMGDNKVLHFMLAIAFLCFSCGIYQAYVSFALMLSICYFLWEILTSDHTAREIWLWIRNQVVLYGGGMLAYLGAWKLCMLAQQAAASEYQGIDNIGKIDPGALMPALKENIRLLLQFFLGGNIFSHGLTGYAALNIVFLVSFVFLLVFFAVKARLAKKPLELILFFACLLVIPVVPCFWLYLSPGVGYHMLMLQSLCVLYLFALFLASLLSSAIIKGFLTVLFGVLVFRFSLQANASYYKMEQCMEHSRTTAIEMLTRIHLLDEGSARRIAFLGGGDQSLIASGDTDIRELQVNAHQLRSTLVFDNLYAPIFLYKISGYYYQPVEESELAALETRLMDEMDTWPGKNSLRIEGDTVIIRLPDPVS